MRSALATLEREGVPVDLTRVAVVGHSLGGVLAVDYAASAAAAGLPVPTAVMSVAPAAVDEVRLPGSGSRHHPRDDPPPAGDGGG